MIVVADSSPLIVLINIDHVELLAKLFQQVIIPPEVSAELKRPNRSARVQEFAASPPSWFIEQTPAALLAIPGLHSGESAAISLALERKADLLLIDEKLGRKAAAERKIPFVGTIAVLELAADRGLIDLAEAFKRVKATDFWISPKLLDQRLEKYLKAKGQ